MLMILSFNQFIYPRNMTICFFIVGPGYLISRLAGGIRVSVIAPAMNILPTCPFL